MTNWVRIDKELINAWKKSCEDMGDHIGLTYNAGYHQALESVLEHSLPLEEPQGDRCSKCDGLGYTSEHDPEDPHEYGCNNCPIQVECDDCRATGKKLVEAQPEKGEG